MGVVYTQHFRHERLGHVYLLVKPTARTMKARWKGQVLQVTCPPVGLDVFNRALNEMTERLLASKPKARYQLGQTFEYDWLTVAISSQTMWPKLVKANLTDTQYVIGVGSDLDIGDESVEDAIDKLLCKIAEHAAQRYLLAEAVQVSKRLGVAPPEGFEIGRGRKRLGCCINRRRISLSCLLAFYPKHLRELIVCHELAHLTHMDHSADFHRLVNVYTHNQEARLEAELRKWEIPVKR